MRERARLRLLCPARWLTCALQGDRPARGAALPEEQKRGLAVSAAGEHFSSLGVKEKRTLFPGNFSPYFFFKCTRVRSHIHPKTVGHSAVLCM